MYFNIFAKNIDCGYKLEQLHQGGSNKYPQSKFWSRNKQNSNTPIYFIKVGYNGVYIAQTCYSDDTLYNWLCS